MGGLPPSFQPLALASTSIHYYACVILLPVVVLQKYSSLSFFEIGIMFTGHTSGLMVTQKFIEPLVKTTNLNKIIHIGFFILVSANVLLFVAAYLINNSSDFATAVFLARLTSGIGSGLIESSCIISRTHFT